MPKSVVGSESGARVHADRLFGFMTSDPEFEHGVAVNCSDGSCGELDLDGADIPQVGELWIVDDVNGDDDRYPLLRPVMRLWPIPNVALFLPDPQSPCGVSAALADGRLGIPSKSTWTIEAPQPFEMFAVQAELKADGSYVRLTPVLKLSIEPWYWGEDEPEFEEMDDDPPHRFDIGERFEVIFDERDSIGAYGYYDDAVIRGDPNHASVRQNPRHQGETWVVSVREITNECVYVVLAERLSGGTRRHRNRRRRHAVDEHV